jgi:hypothetical protein
MSPYIPNIERNEMKDISEAIKSIVQIVASLLQVAMLAAIIGGGWWAFSTVKDYLNKPVTLPEIKLPEFPSFGPKKEEPPTYWRFDMPEGPSVAPPPPQSDEPRKLVV